MASPDAVLACLSSILNASAAAEQLLQEHSKLPGFMPLLAGVAASPAYDGGVRQLAAVVLKQQLKRHWARDSTAFEEPEASDHDRQQVMQALPPGLADPASKLRTAVGMCMAAIYKLDPDSWPGLLENLVAAVKSSASADLGEPAARKACQGRPECGAVPP